MLHNILKNQNLEAPHSISLEAAKKLGDEYGDLMVMPTLSDEQEARMDEILLLATIHGTVDFWVSCAACDRGAEIGLLSPEYLSHYEDQRAVLREQLELDVPPDSGLETALREQVRAAEDKRDETIKKISSEMEGLGKGKAGAGGSKRKRP